jgi:hypothetical protein
MEAMQTKRPKLALAYYIGTFLILLFLGISLLRHIIPIDEALDVAELVAVIVLMGLVLFAVIAAWRAVADGR